MKTKFSKLQLDKKNIAKLNNEQLSAVKGGNNGNLSFGEKETVVIICETPTATVVNTGYKG